MKPKVVFSDFDGTLTHGHVLTREFFDILELLRRHEIPLVIVTGRSKSWAHFFLSHFESIEYVITEGGGVISMKESDGVIHGLKDRLLVPEIEVRRLEHFVEALVKKFPDVSLSADSFGRQTDRAIELSYINANKVRALEIKEFMRKENINFSTSNVHLNFWCGDICKYRAVQYFLENHYVYPEEECLFFGDSLNDQEMFRHFKNSVGVSNISDVYENLKWEPATVLEGKENEGPFGVLNYLREVLK